MLGEQLHMAGMIRNFQTSWWINQDAVPQGNPTEEFHIYAMDWTPNSLKFYYDNQLVRVIYGSPDYEMGTILNIYTDAGSGEHNDVLAKGMVRGLL